VKIWPLILVAAVLTIVLAAVAYVSRYHPSAEPLESFDVVALQRMATPGALSRAHAFLEHDCAACHTPVKGPDAPVKGPDAANCIACHANNEPLLKTQSTAFHASIKDCRGCHIEHQGPDKAPTLMDHEVLVKIAREASTSIQGQTIGLGSTSPHTNSQESTLLCSSCHANQDPHRTLFGNECAACHTTLSWSLTEFRHPTPTSTECAQCHQAPPSHYKMHFEMVSKKVAGIEHADVSQCFLCHQTNSWNDIKGVGWYKHH